MTDETSDEESKRKRINYDHADIDETEELFLPHPFFLRKLKHFDLSDNGLVEIPADFGILNSSLERLVLSGNCLTQIPISLCRGLAQLRHLDLSKNRIRELTDKLRELTNIESLDLSSNQLNTINYELCNELKTLKQLNLSGNSLESMPLFSKRVKSSTATNRPTSSKKPSNFTRSVTPRSNILSSPHSSSSKSSKNSQFTFNLPNLERLDLSANKLKSEFNFYQTFSLCPKLERIELNSNRIEGLVEFEEDDNLGVAVSLILNDKEEPLILNDENMKSLSKPKNKLIGLKSINLSNNRIKFTKKAGFTQMLCRFYLLAPNLEEFYYEQQNGMKIGNSPPSLTKTGEKSDATAKIVDENDIFDVESMLNEPSRQSSSSLVGDNKTTILKNAYELVVDRLKVIDLSFNNLTKLPRFLYDMRNLREIYFNDNLLKKIPNEMFIRPVVLTPEQEANFQRLKEQQAKQERERIKRERRANDPDYFDEDEDEEENQEDEETTKKKKKKKKGSKKEEEKLEDVPVQNNTNLVAQETTPKKLLAETLEILHLSGNRIERVPENLFKKFAILRELKLERNPLKDPPEQSVAVSATRLRRSESSRVASSSKSIKQKQTLNESITFFNTNNTTTKSVFNETVDGFKQKLPDLAPIEPLENLKPLQNYVMNYKNREGIEKIYTIQNLINSFKMFFF